MTKIHGTRMKLAMAVRDVMVRVEADDPVFMVPIDRATMAEAVARFQIPEDDVLVDEVLRELVRRLVFEPVPGHRGRWRQPSTGRPDWLP